MTNLHETFTEEQALGRMITDFSRARALIRIQSPYVTVRRLERLRPTIAAAIARRVCVCVFIQATSLAYVGTDETATKRQQTEECVALLRGWGVHVNERERMHQKLIIIDGSILWDGSLNFLSHFNTTERVNRFVDKQKVREALTLHGLDNCDVCNSKSVHAGRELPGGRDGRQRRIVGAVIEKKRRMLGLTQHELAKRAGVGQSVISKLERGLHDARLSTLDRLSETLGCGLRMLDWFLLPSTDAVLFEDVSAAAGNVTDQP
jgi:DNA-binding XRE family transcriptional regulator